MIIIGLCGFQGSGKDTVADILVEKHNFIKLSFASATKDVVSNLFGWDRNMVEGNTPEARKKREEIDGWWANKLDIKDFSPRKALQLIGTDLFRNNFYDNIWVYIVEKKIIDILEKNEKNIVITDCRFPNEIEMIKKLNGKLVYIKRFVPDWFENYKNGEDLEIVKTIHQSETSWIRCIFDYEINNISSIDDLNTNIQNLIHNIN